MSRRHSKLGFVSVGYCAPAEFCRYSQSAKCRVTPSNPKIIFYVHSYRDFIYWWTAKGFFGSFDATIWNGDWICLSQRWKNKHIHSYVRNRFTRQGGLTHGKISNNSKQIVVYTHVWQVIGADWTCWTVAFFGVYPPGIYSWGVDARWCPANSKLVSNPT